MAHNAIYRRKWWAVLLPKRARLVGYETSAVDGHVTGAEMKGDSHRVTYVVAVDDDGEPKSMVREKEDE